MDIDTLRLRIEDGLSFDYLLFWGHRQRRRGKPDASCLSQWFAARFVVQGQEYATAEHWMMAGKARLFEDHHMLRMILESSEPGKAKALGRRVEGFNERVWANERYPLVLEGTFQKFSQNPTLKQFLLDTGRRVLVEAAPNDSIWGIGIDASHPDARHPTQWTGTNLLGFALMEVRAQLGGANLE